jgi:glyoxylase-like metal-dependent hydrolase (beta-lactamase superfamily II)
MILETHAVEPFLKNGFVLGCERTREGVLIDPGDEAEQLLDAVKRHGLNVRYILLTHAHLDHITGVGAAKAALGAPVGLHADDNFLYAAVSEQGRAFGLHVPAQPPVDFFYDPAGDPLRFGDYEVRVHHTPGHCPGGVCLQVGRAGQPRPDLFVGDTLFAGSIGRTDLPGGNLDVLMRSIRQVLFSFPDDAVVHPGHGPKTTVGHEKRTNPFLLAVY